MSVVLLSVFHNLKVNQRVKREKFHCQFNVNLNLQQISHLFSSLSSPHPSTPLHNTAVDLHLLLSHWNVPRGQVSAKYTWEKTNNNNLKFKIYVWTDIFHKLLRSHHCHRCNLIRHYRRHIGASIDHFCIGELSYHKEFLKSLIIMIK